MDGNESTPNLTPLQPRVTIGPRPLPSSGTPLAPLPQRPAATAAAHAPKARPSATTMRLALGGGGLAILSAVASAIVSPPQPAVLAPAEGAQGDPQVTGTPITVQRPVQYVQLMPGETAPPGATVIDPAAPTPITVITVVPAPAQKPIIIKTNQSGKVVK